MEAYQSGFEQGLYCKLVDCESQSGKLQSLIGLHLLLYAFEVDVIKLYTIDVFLMARPLVTSRRFRFLSTRKSRMRLINSVASCFVKSMLAFPISASFDHRWMFATCLRSRRCLRPISRHMAHVFRTLVVEWIKRFPQDSPVRCSQMHYSLKLPHLQSWHSNM